MRIHEDNPFPGRFIGVNVVRVCGLHQRRRSSSQAPLSAEHLRSFPSGFTKRRFH